MDAAGLQSSIFMLLSLVKHDNNKTNNNHMYLLFVMMFLFQIITKLLSFNDLNKYIMDIWNGNNNYCCVKISSHQIITMRLSGNSTKNIYSDTFMALIHYLINNNIDYDNLNEVLSFNKDDIPFFSKDNIDNKFMYLPFTNKKILINEKYGIYFELCQENINVSNNDEGNNKNKKENGGTNKANYIIQLFIKKNNQPSKQLKILNKFIDECLTNYLLIKNNDINDKNLYIYVYKGFEKDDDNRRLSELTYDKHIMEHNKDLTKNIFFEGKDKLLRYIEPFIYNPNELTNVGEERYRRSGFTFKAGLMFYGSPGCGKTSTIKAILKHTNRHGVIVNLNKIKTCEELESVFRKRVFNGRHLCGKQICYIMEDCDAFENNIITSRNNESSDSKSNDESSILQLATNIMTMSSNNNMESILNKPNDNNDKVNLSCFLNILDGIIELNGVMIIMTTNHPEKIDEALIRPGRFAFKYEFKRASNKIIKEMLAFKFDLSENDINRYTSNMTIKDELLSPAEIQSICFKNTNIIECIHDLMLAAQNK